MSTQQMTAQIQEALDEYDLSRFPRAHSVLGAENSNWIARVSPREEDTVDGIPFVSSEALNIVVFTEPNSDYNATGVVDHPHAQRIIKTYHLFPRYKTLCFLEIGTAAELDEENDNTDATDALLEFEPDLQAICDALEDYGFEYKGQIDKRNGVGQDILDQIDAFLNPT